MLKRSTLRLAELRNETKVLRATLVMLERVARSDFDRLGRYLEGLDRRLQALEAAIQLPAEGEQAKNGTATRKDEDRQGCGSES